LRAAVDAPEVKAAESLLRRQGGKPIKVSEHESKQWVESARRRLAQTPAIADTPEMARDRELLRRIETVGDLSRQEVKAAVREVHAHPQRGADFKRNVKSRQQRRGVR
jgi:hypothetical protein